MISLLFFLGFLVELEFFAKYIWPILGIRYTNGIPEQPNWIKIAMFYATWPRFSGFFQHHSGESKREVAFREVVVS